MTLTTIHYVCAIGWSLLMLSEYLGWTKRFTSNSVGELIIAMIQAALAVGKKEP